MFHVFLAEEENLFQTRLPQKKCELIPHLADLAGGKNTLSPFLKS